MALPLEGVRVLDLTRAVAGPFCAMILGDLGADVVKVEPTPTGEMTRDYGPFEGGVSTYYLAVNRNKRSLALNFRTEAAMPLLHEMALGADVLLENFRTGAAASMGLDYDDDLRRQNQRLIYANITGFGRDGPYGDWAGVDQIAQGMSGLMSITGERGGEPLRLGIPIGDLAAGMWTALGVVTALHQRQNTGMGQRVETSLLAGLVGLLGVQGQRHLSVGDVPKPAGNDHFVIAPYGMFAAKDGPINLAAVTPDMWAGLCRLLNLDALIEHPDFADNSARIANLEALKARLNERFATKTRMEWVHALVEIGIPAGPVYTMEDVFQDPQVHHAGLVEEIEHPTIGLLKQLSNPLRLDTMEGRSVRLPPPMLGQHSRAALTDYNVDAERIDALLNAGVIVQAEEYAT